MDRQNIMFFKNDDESYTMVDLDLNHRFFGYEDSYNHYDIDADKILLFKKSDNEYFIRYNHISKMKIVPLQLKINNFYGKFHQLGIDTKLMSIESNDKELFKKCREISNKITESIVINSAIDFVKNNMDDDDKSIMIDVNNSTFSIEGYFGGDLVIVLHSVIDDCIESLLVKLNAKIKRT